MLFCALCRVFLGWTMVFTCLVCITDKERDVATETERIRQTLQQANNRNTELLNEIKALQVILD